jgi:hypothetical protein
MGDGTQFDDARFGLRGFRVLAVTPAGSSARSSPAGVVFLDGRVLDRARGLEPRVPGPLDTTWTPA